MSAKPAFVDKIFDNPIMKMLKEDDGRYDLDPQVIAQAFGQDKFTNKLSQYIGG